MTTMQFEDFVKLGFNKNEAIVYAALLKLQTATAKDLIQETKFHKNIVYDNLEKLIEKGLISLIMDEGIKTFKAQPADMIITLLEDQEKQIQENKEYAKALVKDIKKLETKSAKKSETSTFKGKKGVQLILKDQLDSGEDYVSFGAPAQSVEIMGEYYWQNFRLRQNEHKIKGKLLFNESLRSEKEKIPEDLNEVRFIKSGIEPMTQTVVYGNKTAIIIWSENPVAMLINDIDVAKSYKEFFNELWKNAKK